jgi:hypothetical protein
MEVGVVHRVVRVVGCVSILALSACSTGSVAGPGDATLDRADGRASGPSGLEQQVVTSVAPAPVGSPYTAILTATSTIVNTGSASAHLTSRVCFFKEADFTSTARLDRFEPTISCAAESAEGDLAPGRSTGPMEVQFGVRSGAGSYTLTLRHSLSPDFRATATFTIR